jgi:hypothetical protein
MTDVKSLKSFELQIKQRCDKTRKQKQGKADHIYKLKPEMLLILKPDEEQEDEVEPMSQ